MKDRIELAKYFNTLGFKLGAEIGVFQGSFSRALCRYNPGLKLYAIDAWWLLGPQSKAKRQEWVYNRALLKLKDYNVVIIKDASLEVAKVLKDGILDFVYIDADHSYKAVVDDIEAWNVKVRSGGIVAGHDYQSPDVEKAVHEYVDKYGLKLETTEYDKFNKRSKLIEQSWWFVKP